MSLGRLAGPPSRVAFDADRDRLVAFDAVVKLRLGHAKVGSVLLPELLFLKSGGWRFYQPSFFGPPILGFNVEPGRHFADFNVDVGAARVIRATRCIIRIWSDGLLNQLPDGAQLYQCQVLADPDLARHSTSRCAPMPDGDFCLRLFHITSPAALRAIRASQLLHSSTWNLQGTRRLSNVAYAYFTSLPRIHSEDDLRRIAMSSDGQIEFQTTSPRPQELALRLEVYRENTAGRTASLPLEVPSRFLSPPHLLLHRPLGQQAYYEVVGPEIFRVGVNPGASLALDGDQIHASISDLKSFEYLVVGDAAELEGLRAPYDEEDTEQVMHIERLTSGGDLFDYWLAHQNSDQMTGRVFERRELEP